MKKLLILALATMAMSGQAAQINWGSTGALYDGTSQMKTKDGYSTQAYLVYLGTGSATFGDINFSTIADDAIATKTPNALGTVSATSGANPIFTPNTTKIGDTDDVFTYGSSVFGIVYVMSNAGKYGSDQYYTTTGPFTLVNSGSSYAAATETTTLVAAVPSGSSWTKIVPVPEPSSAALALAGLALLLKRRRA